MKKKKEKVVILGGGLAGLAAAYELVRKGKEVVVIEKWDDVGGLARTIEKNGFRFDTGPHRWYAKSNMVNKWMLNLLGDEVIKVPRLTRIYFDNKFFYYPIKIKNAFLGIGPQKTLFAVVDYIIARAKARLFSPKITTMEDGYINQFGKTLYETFFKRYSEKLWGRDCKEISADWVGQRTRGLNILTIIKDTLKKSKGVVSLVDQFHYPKRGIGRIAQKLASKVKESGGQIITDCEVFSVFHKKDKIVSITVKKKGKKRTFTADQFISSIPLDDLIRFLSPSAAFEILKINDQLEYRDEVQVALFVKKTHITEDTWIYIHPKKIPFIRVMEMDNWSDELSPKGTTTLVFELATNVGSRLWRKKDRQIIDLVASSYIKEFGLIEKKDIIGGYVHRVPKEYPVYHLTYAKDVAKLKKYLSNFSNLQIVGRNGTFRYNNMDHSIEMGLYSAWNIIQGEKKYDVDSVNIEREYLEEKKIEYPEDISLDEEE